MNNSQKISKKQIKIDGLNVSYKQVGSGSIPIVLLHGWGVSSDKYLELAEHLSQFSIFNFQFSIFIPDLPGFGKSDEPEDEPEDDWNLDNYVEFVDKFVGNVTREKKGFELVKNILQNLDLRKVIYSEPAEEKNTMPVFKTPQPPLSVGLSSHGLILIGHSFGGRIAIKYVAKYPEKIDKLILTGAAGIKHKLTFKQRMFYILAKTGKKIFSLPIINYSRKEAELPIGSSASEREKFNFKKYAQKFLYKLAREKDYYQASPKMKGIMKNVLAEDLTPILEKIKTPTLLVWGKLDNSTPLADGELMNEKIENSELKVIDDANHSLPYQKAEEFAKIINSTLTNTN